MYWAAVAAHERIGNYWHMLPEASQARKAIWDAINPHTGKRRIDEAFPVELREATRANEMLIKLRCGSTWQVVGSDNYNSLIGSPPVGIVFSEFSVADPSSWAYLRPILRENGGWALFIYTSRGRNHGATLYFGAKDDPKWFAELLTVDQTGVLTPDELAEELKEYKRDYGEEAGQAFFDQEYYCSFDSAILGAVYGGVLRRIERKGQIKEIPYDEKLPVHTAWDLGYDDSTAIWFWQITHGEIRLIDYYENNGQGAEHYCELLKSRPYGYGKHYVPHDAANELMAAGGRSIVQQAFALGVKMTVVAATSQQNGIEAARVTLERCWIDDRKCAKGIETLRAYHFPWNEQHKTFDSKPKHDWSSHGCDAFEIIGQVWRTPKDEIPKPKPKFLNDMTADEVFWPKTGGKRQQERI